MELISGYSSESNDEDDDGNTVERPNLKRQSSTVVDDNKAKKQKSRGEICNRLPIPADIRSMFVTEPEVIDNPMEHEGRIRSFSHERGNWASFVYAHVSPYQEECLRDITQYLIDVLRPVADFHACEDLHLSLSRTFILRHHWIEPVVKCLRQKLTACQRTALVCSNLEWYCNDEKTRLHNNPFSNLHYNNRTFVAIHIPDETKILTSYTKAIDLALKEFKLPSYYEHPSFHISLAWCLGDMREHLKKHVKTSEIQAKVLETSELMEGVNVQELRLKTGNKMFSLPLAKR